VGELEGAEMKWWLFVSIAVVYLVGAAAAAGSIYNVSYSWYNPYHTGDPVPPSGQGFYTCIFKYYFNGVYQTYSAYNGYGSQVWSTQISATDGQTFTIQGYVMDFSGNLSGPIPVTLTVMPSSSPPVAQNQDPQVHPVQQRAAVGEPVDAATGYLWYSESLLKEKGIQTLDYAIYGKFGGLGGVDFGSTYDVSIQVYGATIPGVSSVTLSQKWPSVTLSQKGRAVHHYYEHGDGNYYSPELGAQYEWIQPVGDTQYILHRPDQSQLVFSMDSSSGTQTALSGYLSAIINSHGQQIRISRSTANSAQITSVTEPVSGATLTFQHDQNGNLSVVTDQLGRRIVYSYGSTVLLPVEIQVLSESGTVVKALGFTYDQNSNLVTLLDKDGRVIMQNSYDALGRVGSQRDGRGATTLFNYQLNSDGTLTTTVTNRNGKNAVYSFDKNLLLLQKTKATGASEQWSYDSNGNTLYYTNLNGHTTSYSYDSSGNLLSITDPTNQVTKMTYDSLNRLTSITDATNQAITLAYDHNNNVIKITDPLNGVTSQTWDSNSLLLSKVLPRGGTETYTYSGGLLTSKTDANSNTWSFTYDVARRLVSTKNPTQAVTSYSYDALDNVTSITDSLNHSRLLTYNSRGWRLSETDPSGNTTLFQYDKNGNLTSCRDPAPGGTTTYQYDGEDRLSQIIDPLNHTVSYGRDSAGNVISVTDGRGKSQTLQLDGLGHTIAAFDAYSRKVVQNYYDTRELLEESTDGMGRINDWAYDARHAMIQFTDGLNNATAFNYDALRRLTKVSSPLSNVASQGYDQDGNRSSLSNALSKITGFSYDLGDRISAVKTANNLTTTYTHNSRNLVETISKPSGQQTTNLYDPALRLSQVSDSFATTTYQYDNNGRLIETDDDAYGRARKARRVYDSLGRLTSYTDEAGNTIGYAYDQAGNLTRLTYPGGRTVTYTYDQNNRLLTVTDWASRLTTYSYDDNGRLVNAAFPNGTNEARTYDVSGKLTQIRDQDARGNIIYSSTAQIDAADRITGEAISPAPTILAEPGATMTFDADNRLMTYNGQAVSFESDGNMLTGPLPNTVGMSGFTYDARNRLSKGGGISYTYGPDGKRTSWTGYDGVTRNFVIDPSAALDRVLIRTKSTTTTYYVYGLGLIGQEQNGTYQQYHFDSRGSTIAITDAGGAITDRFEYGPYAEPLSHSGSINTPFQFNGRYGVQTDLNGLLCMRARYYDPATQRFINQDVLFGDLNPGISLNRFAFANGNPVSLMDPFGLCAGTGDWLQPITDTVNYIYPWSPHNYYQDLASALQQIDSATFAVFLSGINSGELAFEQATGVPLGAALPEIGAIASIAALEELAVTKAAETTLSSDIAETFSAGKYTSTVLQQDMIAFRYSGGISQPAGRFLTTSDTVSQISSPISASIALSLPEGATAQTLNAFTIPAGTRIFIGGVAGGADTAAQIFIRDPSVLIPY
jgi:RHS repeat-associated protein